MTQHRIYRMTFSGVYPLYVAKAIRKNRTKDEVDSIIRWLTGYAQQEIDTMAADETLLEAFFANAPYSNPARERITGVICGVRIEDIDDPLMQEIRRLDKLVDELAKGKMMDKILRK